MEYPRLEHNHGGTKKLTCRFCGKADDSVGSQHLEIHKVEYLRDIAGSLSTLCDTLANIEYELERMNKGRPE